MPDLLTRTIPSGSTRLTLTFLYSFPLIALKSSAKATDANQRIRKARIFILSSPRKTTRDTIFAGLQSVIQDKNETAGTQVLKRSPLRLEGLKPKNKGLKNFSVYGRTPRQWIRRLSSVNSGGAMFTKLPSPTQLSHGC